MACYKVICAVCPCRIRYGNRNAFSREIFRAYILPCTVYINLQRNIINPDIVIGNAFCCKAVSDLAFNLFRCVQRVISCKLCRNLNCAAHLQAVCILIGRVGFRCPGRCMGACIISGLIAGAASGRTAA